MNRFIDSSTFLSPHLQDLPEIYGIDISKGYFLHKFNRPEHQDYIGKIQEEEDLGVANMMPKDCHEIVYERDENGEGIKDEIKEKQGFLPWYIKQKCLRYWDFKKEIIKCSRADVELLVKTILKFRKLLTYIGHRPSNSL